MVLIDKAEDDHFVSASSFRSKMMFNEKEL